jgi:hypothetical protein
MTSYSRPPPVEVELRVTSAEMQKILASIRADAGWDDFERILREVVGDAIWGKVNGRVIGFKEVAAKPSPEERVVFLQN